MDEAKSSVEGAIGLETPFRLPCGLVVANRLVKAAMSDSLGDAAGNPTPEQLALYRRWADGGAALSLIGEVQVDPRYPENPGNLVLGRSSDAGDLAELARVGRDSGGLVWPQLGHAGALAHEGISSPAGPSPLDLDGLQCRALDVAEIEALPELYASAAARARAVGFTGVQVHAGHGFLLSQFLSPLFNRRNDRFGGSIENRSRVLIDIVRRIRRDVGPAFAIAVKLNSTDQLVGGLSEADALDVLSLLDAEAVDLIDISGGTYFPGAAASSDGRSSGPYFLEFAQRARRVTDTPLMLTGGFTSRVEALGAVSSGTVDLVGLARSLALDPDLPNRWCRGDDRAPNRPRFQTPPPGAITAWFTMRLAAVADGAESSFDPSLSEAVEWVASRDARRCAVWREAFGLDGSAE